jgi:cytochrome aa3-600 menaquinol oxidase subunit 1
VIPTVAGQDAWWTTKEERKKKKAKETAAFSPIHMPKNSGIPFIMAVFWFIAGFGLTFHWVWMAILGLTGVGACLLARSFQYNSDYYIPVDEIRHIEDSVGRVG